MEKLLSRWVRGSCIGRGSFGSVNLAITKSDCHVFAVKSVDRSSALNSQLESLENEIRILRSLSPSPYVVEYLGDDVTCESPTTSYRNLHLEYMPSGTAADLAVNFGADVDERLVRSYTWCIVSALSSVHSQGIVHCDVKGKNVLLGPSHGIAKLADFGSATEFPAKMLPRGSPLWMAPEVIRREYQGPESDVWSLGCTVIEMVTGKPAWEDRGVKTLCRIGNSDELPEFTSRLSELGRDFLDKCLRRDRSERWSCDQLLQHPFISTSSPNQMMTYSSPRCVLDWFDSEFCEEDDKEFQSTTDCELKLNSAKERIAKLGTTRGAIWESDGWVAVRDSIDEREEQSCSWGGREGAISEYPDLISDEEGREGISSEYSNSMGALGVIERANWEYFDSVGTPPPPMDWLQGCDGVWVGLGGSSGCRYGSDETGNWVVFKARDVIFLLLFILYLKKLICNSICSIILLKVSVRVHVNNNPPNNLWFVTCGWSMIRPTIGSN